MRTCAHCGSKDLGAYCSHCGARLASETEVRAILGFPSVRRLRVKAVFVTLRDIWIRPGRVVRDLSNGSGERYVSPVALFVGIGVIYATVRFVSGLYLNAIGFSDHVDQIELTFGYLRDYPGGAGLLAAANRHGEAFIDRVVWFVGLLDEAMTFVSFWVSATLVSIGVKGIRAATVLYMGAVGACFYSTFAPLFYFPALALGEEFNGLATVGWLGLYVHAIFNVRGSFCAAVPSRRRQGHVRGHLRGAGADGLHPGRPGGCVGELAVHSVAGP